MKIDVSKLVVNEAVDALGMRLRWYDVRRCTPPEELVIAFRYFCGVSGINSGEKRLELLRRAQ